MRTRVAIGPVGLWVFSRVQLALMVISTACLAACGGGTPSSPTQPATPDVAGDWHGTMRATSIAGQCASGLQYVVGGTSQFDVRLTRTGSTLAGTVELGRGTCDVTGVVTGNTLTLSTTTCRPRERTIEFFVCEGKGSEFVIRSRAIESSISLADATGKYPYTDDIKIPVDGPVAGVLTENGNFSMSRR